MSVRIRSDHPSRRAPLKCAPRHLTRGRAGLSPNPACAGESDHQIGARWPVLFLVYTVTFPARLLRHIAGQKEGKP